MMLYQFLVTLELRIAPFSRIVSLYRRFKVQHERDFMAYKLRSFALSQIVVLRMALYIMSEHRSARWCGTLSARNIFSSGENILPCSESS